MNRFAITYETKTGKVQLIAQDIRDASRLVGIIDRVKRLVDHESTDIRVDPYFGD